jgi:hypothetical protein
MANTSVRRGAALTVAGLATSSLVLLSGSPAHAQDFGGEDGHHHHKKICHYVVISKHAKIRKGPGFEFRVIGKLHRGQVIKASCKTVHGFVKLVHRKRFHEDLFADDGGDFGLGDFEHHGKGDHEHGRHTKGDLELGDFEHHGKGDHEHGRHKHHKDGWVFRLKLLKLHKRADDPRGAVDTGAGGTADKASPVLPAAAGLGLITLGSGIAITARRRRSAEATPSA